MNAVSVDRSPNPETCEICGTWTGVAYDVHMVLCHPETRPVPQRPPEPVKARRSKKKDTTW